jgi:hypothetical protein
MVTQEQFQHCVPTDLGFGPVTVAYDRIEPDPEHNQGEYFDVYIFNGEENLTYELNRSQFKRAQEVAITHHRHY